MRVLFVNRFFYPDHSATRQMLTDLAADLVRMGLDVTVITGRQRIDDADARLARRERVDGVDVALSAMTMLTLLQSDGFALLPWGAS